MDYRRAGKRIVLRLDEDDEIISAILMVCRKEDVKTASVSGIGALKKVELSHFDSVTKEYTNNSFDGMFEITSMNGNIAHMDGKLLAHIHTNLGRTDLSIFGGHLVRGIVNPTCEIFITPLEAEISKEKDKKTGLSLLRFE